MKLSLVTLTAIVAVANAADNAADCPLTQLTPLLTNTNVTTCATESNFSFASPTIPTGSSLTSLCSSAACQNVLTYVQSLGLGDCMLFGMRLQTDLIDRLTAVCSGNSSSSSAGTSTSSPTVGSTSGNASDSTTSGSTTATTTPTPSPASAAATTTFGVATSAVVIAVVASLV